MNELSKPTTTALSVFSNADTFDHAQRVGKMLSTSNMVPAAYQGNQGIGNCIIALDIAQRVNANPLMVMQNLNIIHGRPSWSAQYVSASLKQAGYDIAYEKQNRGEKTVSGTKIHDVACRVVSRNRKGEKITGPWVSIEMAVKEGWYTKKGSKWQTMPELMLHYRAVSFFGRLYAPELLMGLPTKEETVDVGYEDVTDTVQDFNQSVTDMVFEEIPDEPIYDEPEPEGEAGTDEDDDEGPII